ncbi:MAG TPA: protein kinase [Kofleriaceae bacterium]
MENIGRYVVLRVLGKGGMGDVYLARDPVLEREVAIKLLHADAKQAGLREEAKALARLSHPGIVVIYEIGEHEGQDFIAMEYLKGRTLRQILHTGAQRGELVAICAQVASAIAASHRAGILHRDIKPENIIIGDAGRVKVVDFGIARRLGTSREFPAYARLESASGVMEELRRTLPPDLGTATIVNVNTQLFGTPAYMAPEVLLGGASTAESDVYGLGVVMFECVAGGRPYDGTTVVEVMAQMIEQPVASLQDPLGPIIARSLASDPAHRPRIDEVTAALTAPPRTGTEVGVPSPFAVSTSPRLLPHVEEPPAPPPSPPPAPPLPPSPPPALAPLPPPPRRFPVIAAALLGTGAIALGVWLAAKHSSPPPSEPIVVRPNLVNATVAITPITATVPTYGQEPPHPLALADVLSQLLGQVEGAHITAQTIPPTPDVVAAARAQGATYVLGGTITEDGEQLRAQLTLKSTASGATTATIDVARPAGHTAPLLDAVAAAVARDLAPDARLNLAPNRMRAEQLARAGTAEVEAGRFTNARPYLEQAVDADPTYGAAWYSLVLVLGWMDASDEILSDALQHALATAAPGPQQQMMRGIAAFLDGDYASARAALEPLEAVAGGHPGDPVNRRELLYYLGEANWHDGRHAAAFAYFERALAADARFKPPTVHAYQYALARRDLERARYYVGLAGEQPGWVEFAAGHYTELAASGAPMFKLAAQLVLRQPLSPDLASRAVGPSLDAVGLRVALDVRDGNLSAARAEIAAAWPHVLALRDAHQLSGGTYLVLEDLGETLLAANMTSEARALVSLLASQSERRPVRGYHRLAALLTAATGDPSLLPASGLSERNAQLAAAARAETSGDRAGAVAILAPLVADPTFSWDYPERAALLRNLRALHRTRDAAALCADTLKPALYRNALLALQYLCR